MTPAAGERGSAVIEALVASLIVAATVGASFASIRDGSARTRGLDQRLRAMLVAQSQLATVGSVVPLEPGTTHGVDGGFAWVVEVGRSDGLAASPLTTIRVEVAATPGGPPLATLSTLRLVG